MKEKKEEGRSYTSQSVAPVESNSFLEAEEIDAVTMMTSGSCDEED